MQLFMYLVERIVLTKGIHKEEYELADCAAPLAKLLYNAALFCMVFAVSVILLSATPVKKGLHTSDTKQCYYKSTKKADHTLRR